MNLVVVGAILGAIEYHLILYSKYDLVVVSTQLALSEYELMLSWRKTIEDHSKELCLVLVLAAQGPFASV